MGGGERLRERGGHKGLRDCVYVGVDAEEGEGESEIGNALLS